MAFHDPFHGDVESANKAYIACGKVAMFWGPVEMAVELIVVMLRNRQHAPVKDYAFVDFPVSFGKKKDEIKQRLKGPLRRYSDASEQAFNRSSRHPLPPHNRLSQPLSRHQH